MSFNNILCCLALLVMLVNPVQTHCAESRDPLVKAQYEFDLQSAEKLMPQYYHYAQSNPSEESWLDYSSATLLVAELYRGQFENDTLDKKSRRELGKDIDRIAKDAIDALTGLPDSSERFRLEADLRSTMIRSKFKGMKHQPLVEEALRRAVELDETNANAWVSLASRPLFASPKHGGDLTIAMERLNQALAHDPLHVKALLFRGLAYSKLGQIEQAESDWAQALAINPNTAQARDRLMGIEMP